MPLTSGTRLGAYEIVAPLGAGGMGEIYRARDTRLGREVAVKVLPADVSADPERLARFEREARAVAALNHPNIVTLYSIEEDRGIRFLTMEMVDGQSLEGQVTPGGLPLSRVLSIAIPLADALVSAHERRVVHRDLKPANVMLTSSGRIKVLDFGLAKLMVAGSEHSSMATVTAAITSAGEVMGTVAYMAPEQLRGADIDERTDLFAFGVVLFELLTGRRPFLGATPAELGASILHESQPPLERFRSDLPGSVVRIVARCLDKDPERRIQTAKDVRNELELIRHEWESGSAAAARPRESAASGRDAPSIAVLPFENRGRSEDDEYFADGITEDVIAQLCKVKTLKVISRTSVMPFKRHQESLREIAARLQVAHVLEGSVRRAGDRVRIVAQLVDPASGQNLWAETYDRRLTDIFEIQTEVALHIAVALQAELTPDERKRIRREPTRDVLAYELYLRGRQSLIQFNVAGMQKSIEYFDRAIERDPEYAPAYAGIAMASTELAEHGTEYRDKAGARALSAAAKAVELDPELGDAHCALAYARMFFELDWAAAEAGFKRALELSPGNAFAYDLYGRMCAGLQRFDEAIALHEQAHQLDPLVQRADLATSLLRAGRNEEAARAVAQAIQLEPDSARLRATLGWALLRQGRATEGLKELELAVTLTPSEDMWLAQLGQAYAMAGETAKAREILRKLQDPSRPFPASPYHLAYVHTGLGELDQAMDSLERAYETGGGPIYGMKGSFLLAPLRQHPRFNTLLRRMNLA